MDEFEYVMVLVSIIVGLGVAHILLGVAGIVDRLVAKRQPLQLSIAYFAWLSFVFLWLIQFWWWEFRFQNYVEVWTIGLYLFLVFYAITLFLTAAILVPRDWDSVTDLADYFLERRVPFYSLLIFANSLDIADSFLKGGVENLQATSLVTFVIWGATFTGCVVGIRVKTIGSHRAWGIALVILQIATGFDALAVLGV